MNFNRLASAAISLITFASASIAFGQGNLEGNYVAKTPCAFVAQYIGSVSIPAGKIKVTENVPMSESGSGFDTETPSVSPAIIFQANGGFQSLLTLKTGKVTRFVYGPEPTTMGEYLEQGNVFEEKLSDDSNQGATLIRLEKNAAGLQLTAQDSANKELAACTFLSAY